MRAADLLARGTATLAEARIPDAGRDARRLLAHVLKVPPGRLTLFLPEPVAADLGVVFFALIERRAGRVPISHLTGRRQFFGREFLVDGRVLDPRPETEFLIEAALAQPFASVLDLGTGSGCILLTLLAERPQSYGIGTDLSSDALEVAYWNRNAMRLGDRAALRQGSWFAALDAPQDRFDLIVSNPPYIALDEMAGLEEDVRAFEPRMALTDEADGLDAYRAIARDASAWLEPGGRLLVEIGPTQATAVRGLFERSGLKDPITIKDFDGRDRVIQARFAGD